MTYGRGFVSKFTHFLFMSPVSRAFEVVVNTKPKPFRFARVCRIDSVPIQTKQRLGKKSFLSSFIFLKVYIACSESGS